MPRTLAEGMCNFPLNMTTEERSVWGKLAVENDESIGALIRRAALRGLCLERPEAAGLIQGIRRNHRLGSTVIACCFAFVLWQSVDGEHRQEIRRSNTSVRVVRRKEGDIEA